MWKSRRAFTLIELLAVVAIIGVLSVIALPVYNHFTQQGAETKTLCNMRVMGTALMLYAGDNNTQLPNRVLNAPDPTATQDKWPKVLQPYIQNVSIYSAPIPDVNGKTYRVTDQTKYFINSTNYTSYIYNGFNDMNTLNDPSFTPRLNLVDRAAINDLARHSLPANRPVLHGLQRGQREQQRHPQPDRFSERFGLRVLRWLGENPSLQFQDRREE